MSQKVRIGDKLVESGYISNDQLERALSLQRGTGKRIGETLIEQGLISAESLTLVLTELLNIESVLLTPSIIDSRATNLIPENICKRYTVFPFKLENNNLSVAMADPQDRVAMQDIRRISGKNIIPYIASMGEINQAIDGSYSSADLNKAINEYVQTKKESAHDEINLDDDINAAPIVRLVHSVMESAVRIKASDIHIEQDGDFMRIRFRVDGLLREHMKTSAKPYKAVVSRIKIMAGLNISEKRLPQDGRIIQSIDNKSIDFRVSTMPTSKDEKVVMRVLDKASFMVGKHGLGLNDNNIKTYDELLSKPYGLILVVGPTGSGKTTTLYSMLNQLNSIEQNILTIEDPIEYELEGINQSQINVKAGLDFANALRAFMRQDPDIIMVGEIRDLNTAEIAIRASLTGHLVLSTLHANTAVGAISRLIDMNVPSYLITSSVIGVVSQRLVRKLCDDCKEEYSAEIGEKQVLGYSSDEELTLYRPSGCPRCGNQGYKGRVGVYEFLTLDKEIRNLINSKAKEDEILDKAKSHGMRVLKDDAVEKVLEGTTTIEEMLKVTFTAQ
ncbi:type II/IV secretion system protein [Romboutsia weinsteinii]|uniref:Type II/IV secretion system protein n=1 Tax=Romboutsia weinsteinii TaxID=2020949 RepID=A0A371J1L3_9FIRM|nr:GspE/PulE family protein [Romboutsia weinsteinii]RDY26660.1 type II/IV secretion system protein [Romboutsia weinsteinii]